MKTKKEKQFGKDWSDGKLKFPKHLTPRIIHSALFIYSADSKEETKQRVDYCVKESGNEVMSYVMGLLILPQLIEDTMKSDKYKDFQTERNQGTIH